MVNRITLAIMCLAVSQPPIDDTLILIQCNQTACQAPLTTVLINSYRTEAYLFVDGDVIKSREGTIQGDPLVMPMYAIATIPMIKRLNATVNQVWYADNAAGMGQIDQTRSWFSIRQ